MVEAHHARQYGSSTCGFQFPTKPLERANESMLSHKVEGNYHGDLGSHNFLVQNDGTLALADFGGSRIDGCECLEHPPARYTRPAVISQLGLQPTEKDDLFALGTVLFEISTCQQLYQDKRDSEIRDLFAKQIFPDLAPVAVGVRLVIEKCWKGGYNSAEGVSRDMR
jgi:serine/threonine protein kinase